MTKWSYRKDHIGIIKFHRILFFINCQIANQDFIENVTVRLWRPLESWSCLRTNSNMLCTPAQGLLCSPFFAESSHNSLMFAVWMSWTFWQSVRVQLWAKMDRFDCRLNQIGKLRWPVFFNLGVVSSQPSVIVAIPPSLSLPRQEKFSFILRLRNRLQDGVGIHV